MNWTNDAGGTLWLVRHGESTWNVLGLVQGHAAGPTLTERGLMQSAQVADHFRALAVGAIYASDLERAQQTAEVVSEAVGLTIRTDSALRERCFGSYEGRPLSALEPVDSGIRGDQIIDVTACPDGGESLQDVYARVGDFVERIRREPRTGDVVVVTHGGAIRAMRAYCAGVPMHEREWDVVPNGSVWDVRQPSCIELSPC